jgi:DNA-directed RNA polymerase specialized sigma24 family protein
MIYARAPFRAAHDLDSLPHASLPALECGCRCRRTMMPPGRSPRGFNDAGFRALLQQLGPDEEHAAAHYEQLRQKLITFFAGRASAEPEERADETLDRLGRRVQEGEVIRDLGGYAYGIAKLVLGESTRRHRRRHWLLRTMLPPPRALEQQDDPDPRLECVRACVARLRADDRQLIFEYYQDDGRDRQHTRRAVAERLGILPGALRLRVFRVRGTLEECARLCLRNVSRPAAQTAVGVPRVSEPGEPT